MVGEQAGNAWRRWCLFSGNAQVKKSLEELKKMNKESRVNSQVKKSE
jgi:hypothetical protein